MNKEEVLTLAQAVVRNESAAVAAVADQLGDDFLRAVEMVAGCHTKIMVTGAGTSGAIAHRMAHLLATCGMTALSITPADALHGQLSMVSEGDVLIVLSKAGRSAEINQFAGVAKERGCCIIAMTWRPDSELGQLSDLTLQIPPFVEGEGEGVLPFGSTLATAALGDALCLAAKKMRNFDLATLAQTHPSGATADLVRK